MCCLSLLSIPGPWSSTSRLILSPGCAWARRVIVGSSAPRVCLQALDLDELLGRLSAQSDGESAAGPELFSFAVAPGDAPIVEAALDHAPVELHGKNRKGRALVSIARTYVASLE